MSKRGINIHCFECYSSLSVLFFRGESSHIVKSVAELYKYNTYILIHRKKHLTDIFYMRLLLVGYLYGYDLRKTVDKHGNVL